MPQVPEVGVQSVLPVAGAQPLQDIRAPSAAFGAPVAEGLGNLGKSAEEASNLFAAHAEVMQGLQNKANSDQAAIASDTAMNQLSVDFAENVRGANATQDAYNEYVGKLSAARETARNELTSPMAKALFDSNTRRTQFSFQAEASRHLAAENHKYVVDSAQTQMQTAGDLVVAHPNDPDFEHAFLTATQEQTRFLAKHEGLDAPDSTEHADLMALKVQGQVFAETALNLQVQSPPEAVSFLVAHREMMDPKTYTSTLMRLQPSLQANEAANIAHSALTAAMGGVDENVANAHGFFTGQGWTPEQAAGIVGNLKEESGVNPHPTGYNDGGEASGVAQWHKDRQANFKAFTGHDIAGSTLDEQLAFVHHELTAGEFAAVGEQLRKAKTAEEAAAIVMKGYENPADQSDKAVAGRAAQAREVYIGMTGPKGSIDSATGGAMTSDQLQALMPKVLSTADALAETSKPGNQAFKDTVEARAQANLNRQINAAKDVETSAYLTLAGKVVDGDIQDLPTLLRSSPDALAAYNTLPATHRLTLESDMKRNGNELTAIRQQNIMQANGLYANRTNDPTSYLSANISAMDLPTRDRIALLKQQQEFRGKPEGLTDKVFNAITSSPEFKSSVSSLGLKPKSDEYNHLLGTVSAELDAYRADNPNRAPDQKALAGIIARATARQSYGNYLFGVRVGDAAPGRAYDVDPKDAEAARVYLRAHGQPDNEMNVGMLLHGSKLLKGAK